MIRCFEYGPHALLVQFADRVGEKALARCLGLTRELEENPLFGLVEYVPAFTTILLEFDPRIDWPLRELSAAVVKRFQKVSPARLGSRPVKEVPVVYDGPDLERVAEAKQLSLKKLCDLHAAPVYLVYMLGFAPGFPYLGKLDSRLHMPRLASPRTSVPAGSVAIGGEHTGIYSVESPGGWNIIGHTPVPMFSPRPGTPDVPDESMFYLNQGDRVKFVPVASSSGSGGARAPAGPSPQR